MIYLNNTATSFPKPLSVINAINDYLSNPPTNLGRSSGTGSSYVDDSRSQILDFFNAKDYYNLVFTSGSTEAINLTILGLDINGKEVIISSNEHNAVIRPLMDLQNKGIITIKIAQCDSNGFLDINSIKELISDNTGLIVINYISNVTGNIQDVVQISNIARSNNIKLLIDGSQAAGNLIFNLSEIEPDFFSFTGHKSLFGIQGIGGLIFKKNAELKPLKFGGTGFKSTSIIQPEEFPHKYEAGTQNIPGIISIKKGIEYINEVGLANILSHKKKMMTYVIEELSDIENVKLYHNKENYSYTVLSFNIDKLAPEESSYMLKSGFDIEVRSGIHCAPLIHHNLGTYPNGTVRVSPSYFTKEEEIEIFVDAIKSIAKDY